MAFAEEQAVTELAEAIGELDRAVNFAPYVDPVWLRRWREFVRRWRAEYAAYDELGERLDPNEGRKRLDRYGDAWLVFKAHWEDGIPQRRPGASSTTRAGAGAGAAVVLLGCGLLWLASK